MKKNYTYWVVFQYIQQYLWTTCSIRGVLQRIGVRVLQRIAVRVLSFLHVDDMAEVVLQKEIRQEYFITHITHVYCDVPLR